jgi:hypothetical protein
MMNWVNTHGEMILAVGYIVTSLGSTLPPLPQNATWAQQWLYGFAHVLTGNVGKITETLGIKSDSTKKDGQ